MDEECAGHAGSKAIWNICYCNCGELQERQGDCYTINLSNHDCNHHNTADMINDRGKSMTNHYRLRSLILIPRSQKYW